MNTVFIGGSRHVSRLSAQAQGQPKDLQWTHAFDLACRKLGEDKFTKDTQKFGVEAFRDKNNVVRVAVAGGATATPASARRDLARVRGTHVEAAPRFFHVPEGRAVKVVYSTESAPNSVTGKRVTLVVDRYYLRHGGREAVVDLGTPRGVDNVDAYRLMIESFRWR